MICLAGTWLLLCPVVVIKAAAFGYFSSSSYILEKMIRRNRLDIWTK